MQTGEDIITFPCSFPVKVMGFNSEAFTPAVLAIFQKHLEQAQFSHSTRLSSKGKYLSLTVTFTAQSREQLNAIYEELNRHELVVMTL